MDKLPIVEGIKFDQLKLRWNLVVWDFLEAIVRVLMFGASKYADDNWKRVPNRNERYKNASMRHLVAYIKGEKNDQETGESHLAHIGCCLMFLFWMDLTGDKDESI